MSLRELRLLVAADSPDHGRAEMLCPLAEDQTDAAGRRMQQDRIAGFDAIGLADQILNREALQHHGGRGAVIDAVGQLEQAVGGDQPRFGVGTERRSTIGDTITGLQIGHACADLLDHTGRFTAEAARQLHGIKAGAVIDVDEVQPDRGMANARLPRAGLAERNLLPDQNLGTAGFVKADGVRHAVNSLVAIF